MRTTLAQKQQRELAKLRAEAEKLKGQQCAHCASYSLFYFIKGDADGSYTLPFPHSWRMHEDDDPPDALCCARCPKCQTFFRVAILKLYNEDDDNTAGLRTSDVVAELLAQEETAEATGVKTISSS